MPIFEFRCESCQNVFELLAMSQKDQVEAKCPECGGQEISRVMSTASAVINNGSGPGNQPTMQSRNCGSGNCATITLPGHTR